MNIYQFRRGCKRYLQKGMIIICLSIGLVAGFAINVFSGGKGEVFKTAAAPAIPGEYSPDKYTVLLMHFDEGKGPETKDASQEADYGLLKNMDESAWVTGVFGTALSFNGKGYVVLQPSEALNMGEEDFTIEAWVKPGKWLGAGYIFQKGNPAHTKGRGYDLRINSGVEITAQANDGNGVPASVSVAPGTLADGQWHHIAACFAMREGKISIFMDGELLKEGTTAEKNINTPDVARIGSFGGNEGFYRGAIDELRVSRKIRLPKEMNTIGALPQGKKTIRYASISSE